MDIFHIKQNDTSPSLGAYLKDPDGVAVDLTDAVVVFNLRDRFKTLLIDNASVEVLDAVAGHVRYDWKPEDTATAGDMSAEFEVTFNNGTIQSFPNHQDIRVRIREQVG